MLGPASILLYQGANLSVKAGSRGWVLKDSRNNYLALTGVSIVVAALMIYIKDYDHGL